MQHIDLRQYREDLTAAEAAEERTRLQREDAAQTDHLCPQCQLTGKAERDHNYLYDATDEDGSATYHCPVCEKTYPLAEWFGLMAEAYARSLDAYDEMKSDKLSLEFELRNTRQLLASVLETATARQNNPGLYERGHAAVAGNLGANQ